MSDKADNIRALVRGAPTTPDFPVAVLPVFVIPVGGPYRIARGMDCLTLFLGNKRDGILRTLFHIQCHCGRREVAPKPTNVDGGLFMLRPSPLWTRRMDRVFPGRGPFGHSFRASRQPGRPGASPGPRQIIFRAVMNACVAFLTRTGIGKIRGNSGLRVNSALSLSA